MEAARERLRQVEVTLEALKALVHRHRRSELSIVDDITLQIVSIKVGPLTTSQTHSKKCEDQK